MPATLEQAQNEIAVKFANLDQDELLLRGFTYEESLGRLFTMQLDLASPNKDIEFDDVVGQRVTVSMSLDEGPVANGNNRFFDGFVSEFVQTSRLGQLAEYRATVVPWLWFLTRTADCRIFQRMRTPDILDGQQGVFADYPDSIRSVRSGGLTSAEYREWDFCVQYRETDFDFVSRLMEQEGIYYYFEHSDGDHELVLVDDSNDLPAASGEVTLCREDNSMSGRMEIWEWIRRRSVQPDKVVLSDYDFINPPNVNQNSNLAVERRVDAGEREIYDYPGEYDEVESGERRKTLNKGEVLAQIRLDEIQSRREVNSAVTNARELHAGCTFTLRDHESNEVLGEYLVVSQRCEARTASFYSDDDPRAAEAAYACRLEVMPASQVFRPARTTPRPLIRGPQTAVVVAQEDRGMEMEEGHPKRIHTDKYGRVKVQFHWDRYGKKGNDSSCWIRVSQAWAGNQFGAMFIPHVGQEVIVEFMEGDPDQPIITGRVYNEKNMPPRDTSEPDKELPEIKHKSIIKDDFGNEIIFDSTPGKERLRLYSPNGKSAVEIGSTGSPGGIRTFSDEDQTSLTVGNSAEATIGSKWGAFVGVQGQLTVGLKLGLEVAGSVDLALAGKVSATYGFNYSYFKGHSISNGAKDSLNTCSEDYIIDGGQSVSLSGGDSEYDKKKPNAKNGRVRLDKDRVTISYGKADSPEQDPGHPKRWFTAAGAYSLLGTAGVVAAGDAGSKAEGAYGKEFGWGTWAAYGLEGLSAIALGALYAFHGYKGHNPVEHFSPAVSRIVLDNGAVRIACGPSVKRALTGESLITLTKGGIITIKASKKIILDAPDVVVKQNKIIQPDASLQT